MYSLYVDCGSPLTLHSSFWGKSFVSELSRISAQAEKKGNDAQTSLQKDTDRVSDALESLKLAKE
jgi:hypothetical protein